MNLNCQKPQEESASYGWLLTVGYDLKIYLLHPFTRQHISLPPLLAFKKQHNYCELTVHPKGSG